MRRSLIVLAVAGCGGPTTSPDGSVRDGSSSCPLGADQRALMHEITDEVVSSGLYVAGMSHYREAAFALLLPGVEEGWLGVASLAFDCTDASFYDPYCDEGGITPGGGEPTTPFWETRNRCGRLGCGGPGVDIQQIYMTMQPRTAPDDRHVFTYASVEPSGTITWDPNPWVEWRVARSSMIEWRVTSEMDHSVDVALAGGGAVALSHTVSVDIEVNDGEVTAAAFTFHFPAIAAPAPVDASLAIDASGALGGSIEHAGVRLGEWTGRIDAPSFEWLPPCAP